MEREKHTTYSIVPYGVHFWELPSFRIEEVSQFLGISANELPSAIRAGFKSFEQQRSQREPHEPFAERSNATIVFDWMVEMFVEKTTVTELTPFRYVGRSYCQKS